MQFIATDDMKRKACYDAAILMDKLNAEIARTDGPSEAQVEAAVVAYYAPLTPLECISKRSIEDMRRALTAAGVRAPRVTVPDNDADNDEYGTGYRACRCDFIQAIRSAGCVPVDQKGNEIK
jgi:hypothetical protein